MSITDKFKNWKANKRQALIEELLEIHYSIGDVFPYPDPVHFEVCWHDTPESIHCAYWTPMAANDGLTYDAFMQLSRTGYLEDGSPVELTKEQELADINKQQVWGFCDWINNKIHVWLGNLPHDDPRTEELVHTMLASEIGHLTPNRHPNEQLEQWRVLQMAAVARATKMVVTDALGRLKGKQL